MRPPKLCHPGSPCLPPGRRESKWIHHRIIASALAPEEHERRDQPQGDAAHESEWQSRRGVGLAKAAAVDVEPAKPRGGERESEETAEAGEDQQQRAEKGVRLRKFGSDGYRR